MKTLLKSLILLSAAALLFAACQSDSAEIVSQGSDDTITASSQLAGLLQVTGQNDGTKDDFIDGISATSVVFPYVVETDFGAQTITSEQSLLQFKQTFQANASATASSNPPRIRFPFKVRFKDHSEREIKDDDDWNEHVSKENEESEDDFRNRIKCFEINYPVTLLLFNTNQEQTGSVVVNNNRELFAFFTQLPASIIVTIDYPISITFRDGVNLQINSNRELLRVLLECRNSDDNDDDDTIDDDIPSNLRETAFELRRTLLANDWFVTQFINQGTDRTLIFNDVKFQFFRGGAIKITKGADFAFGRWEIELEDSNRLAIDLEFNDDNQLLENLDEDWVVREFTNTLLNLVEDDDNTTTLKLERTPNGNTDGGDNTNPSDPLFNVDEFRTVLKDSIWTLARFVEDNEEQTSVFAGFSFEFTAEATVKATRNGDIIEGTYSIQLDSFGAIELLITFPENTILDELSEDWLLLEMAANRLAFKHQSGDGSIDEMVLER